MSCLKRFIFNLFQQNDYLSAIGLNMKNNYWLISFSQKCNTGASPVYGYSVVSSHEASVDL